MKTFATLTLATALATVSLSGTAYAATNWSTYSQGIAGVHASGSYVNDSSGITITGNVEDTLGDNKAAKVHFRALITDGNGGQGYKTSGWFEDQNGSSSGTSPIWYKFNRNAGTGGGIVHVDVQECIDNSLSAQQCSGWIRIYG